ncbi:hypothetical protein CK203_110217 [Vitis vinifera]|uniref:Serine hydroxymethyltransferase-like domain-containing protein n=1 Tax=Vitis vinifera TaxID=29760 RepID=A0A438BQ99_VITVI|nr:hypothetical protein CK203_110217 [Vitis vinifera]
MCCLLIGCQGITVSEGVLFSCDRGIFGRRRKRLEEKTELRNVAGCVAWEGLTEDFIQLEEEITEERSVCRKKGDIVIGGTVNEDGVVHVETMRLDQKGLCHRFVQLAGKLHKHPKPWITSSMDGFSFAPSGSTDHGIRHPIKLNSAKPCRSYIERSLITGKLLSFVSIIVPENGGSEVSCIDYGLNAAGHEGLSGRGYYGGNEFFDELEILCQKRALAVFHLKGKT